MSTEPLAPPSETTALPGAAVTVLPADQEHWAGRSPVRGLLRAIRVKQWSKNVIVFVAPAAAGVLRHGGPALHALGAFGIFCIAASGTYLFNDALDVAADRLHPTKRTRPFASGALGIGLGVAVGALLVLASLTGAWLLAGWPLAVVMGAYVASTLSYSLWLKHQPVVELIMVAAGFVLRAIAGGVATHVPFSSWFLAVITFGALFVVTGKRAAEHSHLGEGRGLHRAVLADYTPTFLRSTLTLTASVMVTAYCLWGFDRYGLASRAGHEVIWIQLSVVPVIAGVLYVLWLFDAGHGGAPEELAMHDRFLQVAGVAWVLCFALGLYG